MTAIRSIQDAKISEKRVLIRCGFDAPLDEQGQVANDDRLRECLPTLTYLLKERAKVIICSHNGRPKGKRVEKLSMETTARRLGQLLERPVKNLDDCLGVSVTQAVFTMKPGDLILLENLRFHPEEEINDHNFSKELASLGEVYVNEAFANCHRQHASMVGVTQFLPAYAGFRLQKEIETLSEVLMSPMRPFVAVIGGAKISDKIKVINKLLETADHVLIGGALANTILKAKGMTIGKSLVEDAMMGVAKELPLTSTQFHVPVDVITAHEISKNVPTQIKAVGNVTDDEYILDIGPDTLNLYGMIIQKAKMVVWGGPMGYFEIESFAQGTNLLAKIICASGATSIVGGGDTIEALEVAGCKNKISFVSTGGGAMLEFLEGKILPGIKPLLKK